MIDLHMRMTMASAMRITRAPNSQKAPTEHNARMPAASARHSGQSVQR